MTRFQAVTKRFAGPAVSRVPRRPSASPRLTACSPLAMESLPPTVLTLVLAALPNPGHVLRTLAVSCRALYRTITEECDGYWEQQAIAAGWRSGTAVCSHRTHSLQTRLQRQPRCALTFRRQTRQLLCILVVHTLPVSLKSACVCVCVCVCVCSEKREVILSALASDAGPSHPASADTQPVQWFQYYKLRMGIRWRLR